MKHTLQLLIYHILLSFVIVLHLVSETSYSGQDVLAVAGVIIVSCGRGSFS